MKSGIEFIRKNVSTAEGSIPAVPSFVDFVEPNLNLLAHAQSIDLEIGSRCGGHGRCGGDRIRILSNSLENSLSPITDAEREHLTSAELKLGFRLACQCFPNDAGARIRVEFV